MKKAFIILLIILLIILFGFFYACRDFVKITFDEKFISSKIQPYYHCKCAGIFLDSWNKREPSKCIGITYECKKVN